MSPFYQPDRRPTRYKVVDPLDKITDLAVKIERNKAVATDPLSLDNVNFVLSRVYRSEAKKNKPKKNTKPKIREVAAATVESVEGSVNDGFDISLHFCALTAGEPVEFSQTIHVMKPDPMNLDDYHSRVTTGALNPSRLRTEFKYLLRAIGKEAFQRLKDLSAKSKDED